ncbi:hypothetical protein F5Y18DRAFT_295021 [Xylariaceae sp. FL1019]|nr:hypothetical protein F5Y18DRAFT_295021 [Xylariaceae sp. FL1019]
MGASMLLFHVAQNLHPPSRSSRSTKTLTPLLTSPSSPSLPTHTPFVTSPPSLPRLIPLPHSAATHSGRDPIRRPRHCCPGSISWSWRSLILDAAGLAHSAPTLLQWVANLRRKIGGERGRGSRGAISPAHFWTFIDVLSVACSRDRRLASSSSALPFPPLAFHGFLLLSKLLHLAFATGTFVSSFSSSLFTKVILLKLPSYYYTFSSVHTLSRPLVPH